jgi:hypothetical protein
LLLGLVQNAINLLNVPPNYDYVVSGLVIGAAAGLDVFRRSFTEAALRRRSIAGKRLTEPLMQTGKLQDNGQGNQSFTRDQRSPADQGAHRAGLNNPQK